MVILGAPVAWAMSAGAFGDALDLTKLIGQVQERLTVNTGAVTDVGAGILLALLARSLFDDARSTARTTLGRLRLGGHRLVAALLRAVLGLGVGLKAVLAGESHRIPDSLGHDGSQPRRYLARVDTADRLAIPLEEVGHADLGVSERADDAIRRPIL